MQVRLHGQIVTGMMKGWGGIRAAEVFENHMGDPALYPVRRSHFYLRMPKPTRHAFFLDSKLQIAAGVQGLVTPLKAALLMPASSLSLCLTAWLAVPRK